MDVHSSKRSKSDSARIPQKVKVLSSKAMKFCETSSILETDYVKNQEILRDLLRKWKVWACLVPMRFAIFALHVSKVLRLPRKNEAKSYEVLNLSHKTSFKQTWRPDAPTCNPSQEISALTSCACHATCIFADLLQTSHACCEGSESIVPATQNNAWTSNVEKSGPNMWCFYNFDFQTRFAPQASRHNGGSAPAALASLLFDPPEPQNIGKNTVLRDLSIFARLDLLSTDSLFSDLLSSSFLFSDSSHLSFSMCSYCRKFDFQTSFDSSQR